MREWRAQVIIKPQGDWLLIQPLQDEVTYKGLHLPDTAKAKANNGTVMACGQWCNVVQAGDWVVFSRRQAQEYQGPDGTEYVFVREGGVMVTLEEIKDESIN